LIVKLAIENYIRLRPAVRAGGIGERARRVVQRGRVGGETDEDQAFEHAHRQRPEPGPILIE
jgi:hypothetical protein